MKIAPSILSADFSRIGEEIKAVCEAGADYLHVDVMDGRFVPNITIGPFVVEAAKKCSTVPLDVHLMIVEPEKYIDDFVSAGSDIVTIHAEATDHLHRAIEQIKNAGAKAGVTITPATPNIVLENILCDVDLILIMSVNPGFGGQSFIPQSINKIKDLRSMMDKVGSKAELEVDGGIKINNIKAVADAGADVFVAGSAIFKSDDYKKTIDDMRAAIKG